MIDETSQLPKTDFKLVCLWVPCSTEAEDELDRAQVFKTAMCKFWRRGTCIYGENCNFVHGEEEKQPLYKAKLCKYFQRGHCTRGANCTFAHGVEELQAGVQDKVSRFQGLGRLDHL